jgi:hypothetical protein
MKLSNLIFVLPSFLLSGCVLSEELSPPPNGKTVKVSVIKPNNIDILPMDVIYRSEKCRDKIFTSTGAISSRDGYHLLTVPFKPGIDTHSVTNNVALDGGGQCDWKLSNIKIQFEYKNIGDFGSEVTENTPEDIVFMFDNNDPPRGDGHYENVSGNIVVKKDYYPTILKSFTEDGKDVFLINGQPMLTYRTEGAETITFNPYFHPDLVVNVYSPEKKGDGYVIVYPNGDKLTDHSFPNSEKTKYDFVKQRAK